MVPAGDFQALSEETETIKNSGPGATPEPAPKKLNEKDISSVLKKNFSLTSLHQNFLNLKRKQVHLQVGYQIRNAFHWNFIFYLENLVEREIAVESKRELAGAFYESIASKRPRKKVEEESETDNSSGEENLKNRFWNIS